MTVFVGAPALLRLSREILERSGCATAQAELVADSLVWCDRVGRPTQGVWRLPILSKRLSTGAINGRAEPRFMPRAPAATLLNGDGGSGHFTGALAIDAACELARAHGVGAAGVVRSNYFGAGAWFVERAARQGFISLAASNSFPKVAAHGGLRAVLGTNPLAFGAPRRDGRSLLLDMATSALAGSEVTQRAEAGGGLQSGQAIDAEGRPLLDAAGLAKGALLPMGGAKGFGLALLVEVLSAVLTGAGVATQVRSMYGRLDAIGDNGHFFIALDVARWTGMEAYYERLEGLIQALCDSGRRPDDVRYPGEGRWLALERTDREGIPILPPTLEKLELLAHELSVALPW